MAINNAVIYARVSSTGDRQSTDRQVKDLQAYAAAVGLDVVRVFEEKASGAKLDREVLAECVEFLQGGGAQHLLVSELSRLGRNLRQVLEVVEELTDSGVNIYFHDHRMNTLKEDGSPDPITKLLVSLMGTFAEMEREQISYRLNSGRQRAIEKGVKMGRKSGFKLSDKEIVDKYPKVARMLRQHESVRVTAKNCDVSPTTVLKVKKAMPQKKK